MEFYNALTYAVLVAKFIRLLWPLQNKDGSALADWPVFGPFGLMLARQHRKQAYTTPLNRQELLVYIVLLAIVPAIYGIRALDIKTPLAFWAAIGVGIILVGFPSFLRYLDKRETEYNANRDKAAALAATKAQNAELEQKNAELAQLNALLAAQHAQLEQAYREKDEALQLVEKVFKTLATAAHDLRAPLITINLRANLLMDANETERPNAILGLRSAVSYVCEGLDQAIHQAKLTNKLTLPKVRAVYLPGLLYTLHGDWSEFAFEKGLAAFQVYPKFGSNIMVASDTWVLQRILRNLVVNAIEHSHPGNGIGLSMRLKNGRCLVRVWNTGNAIPNMGGADWDANFTRFVAQVRASGHRSAAAGHGLGLESVAQLCEVLGLKMGLHSRPKRGTVFGFALELANSELVRETEEHALQEQTQLHTAIEQLGLARVPT